MKEFRQEEQIMSVTDNAPTTARYSVPIPAGYGFDEGRFFARIRGLTPLLMHSPAAMKRAEGVQKSGKNILPSEDEAEQGTYRLPNGVLYLPSRAVQRAMIEAAKHFKDPAYTRQTMVKPIAASMIPPDDLGYPLADHNGELLRTYEVDVSRVTVQRNAVLRSRPKLADWTCEVVMTFDRAGVDPKMLAGILATAGQKVGVLDFRPEKGGSFGRFEVESFEVEEPLG